jgi:hypothetical protein
LQAKTRQIQATVQLSTRDIDQRYIKGKRIRWEKVVTIFKFYNHRVLTDKLEVKEFSKAARETSIYENQ